MMRCGVSEWVGGWRRVQVYWFNQGWTQTTPGTHFSGHSNRLKGTVRPDWICMRVVSLDRPWKSHQLLKVFDFLILVMNFWKNFKVLRRFTQKWVQTPACLDHGLCGHKPQSFPPIRAPKMPKKQQLFFGVWLVSRIFQLPPIQVKIEQPFGGFFQQIKVRQAIGRKGSIQTVIRTSRRLDSFCLKRLRTLKSFHIFKTEI